MTTNVNVPITRVCATYAGGWPEPIVLGVGGGEMLTVTEDWVSVDRREGKRWRRLFDIPATDVARVDVERIEDARSSYGWSPVTGFLHSSRHVAPVTGVAFVLRSGAHVVFRMTGAPIEVRAQLAPVLERFA